MTFIAGGYTMTYNAKALGQTADGIRITYEIFKRIITGHYGADTPQDAVYRGQRRSSAFRLIEANAAGLNDLVYPYSDTPGDRWALGVIGLLDVRGNGTASPTTRVKSLILTAIAGTSAYGDSAATMTLPQSILAENFPVEVLLAPDLQEVPIRLSHYPDMTSKLYGSNT